MTKPLPPELKGKKKVGRPRKDQTPDKTSEYRLTNQPPAVQPFVHPPTLDGLTQATAFVVEGKNIRDCNRDIYGKIESINGGKDGNFFVLSEQILQDKQSGFTFRAVCTECRDGKKRVYFFRCSQQQ